MAPPPLPQAEILLQTRGLQWPGQKWDISRLLGLNNSHPGLQCKLSKHKEGSSGGGPRIYVKGEFEADGPKLRAYQLALDAALNATTCVLSVSGDWGLPYPPRRSRKAPDGMDDVFAVQPEFDLIEFPLGHAFSPARYNDGPSPIRQTEYNMSIRSGCLTCYRRHDRTHTCCELAVQQPGTTGLHSRERESGSYSNTCALEAFRCSLPWPVPGMLRFPDQFPLWYYDARIAAIRERNNELQRRVDCAVFHVLSLARIALRPATGHYTARLPLEVMMNIVECAGRPVLTDVQISRLIAHAVDVEGTRTVAHVLRKAARPNKQSKFGEAFPEARRIMLRDEWLYNGGFCWEHGYEAAKAELGWHYTKDDPGTWPALDDLSSLLQFLAFAPPSNAIWPHKGGNGQTVQETMEKCAPWAEVAPGLEWNSGHEMEEYSDDEEHEEDDDGEE